MSRWIDNINNSDVTVMKDIGFSVTERNEQKFSFILK